MNHVRVIPKSYWYSAIIAVVLIHTSYRMFIFEYDHSKNQKYVGVLKAKPKFFDGGRHGAPYWIFFVGDYKFELTNINPTKISKSEILQFEKGDHFTCFTNSNYSLPSLFDWINGRKRIVGFNSPKYHYYNATAIQKDIRRMDTMIFTYSVIIALIFIGYRIYKRNTTNIT